MEPLPAPPSIAALADAGFEALAAAVDAGGAVPLDQLARLGLLLGRNWAKALAVVDAGEVACYQAASSGRTIFQVHGKSGTYLTLARSYCSCPAHTYEVVGKSEAPFCKHQLAARVALVLKRCSVTVVPDAVLAEHLLAS